jgi:hypothetical protein
MKVKDTFTPIEANAIMVMLDSEMESLLGYEYRGLEDWENFDLDAAKLTAYKKFRTWYNENYMGGDKS